MSTVRKSMKIKNFFIKKRGENHPLFVNCIQSTIRSIFKVFGCDRRVLHPGWVTDLSSDNKQ